MSDIMETFLTEKIIKKFDQTTLEYIYHFPLNMGDFQRREIASNSEEEHYKLIEFLIRKELISYDIDLVNLVKSEAIFPICSRIIKDKDAIIQIGRYNGELLTGMIHMSNQLSDYQMYRIRLWYEYFHLWHEKNALEKPKDILSVNFYNKNSNEYIKYDFLEADSLMSNLGILDDNKARKLQQRFELPNQ